MDSSKTSLLEAEVSELKTLVNNLLDKVNKLTTENTALREEVRHLKKLKGQPKIRPNKKAPEDGKDDKASQQKSASGNTPPPKSKRPRSQKPGQTAKPSPSSIREEICSAEGVQDNWKSKGYRDFTHVDGNYSTKDYKAVFSRLLLEYAKCSHFGIKHNTCIDACPLHNLAGYPEQAGTHPA